MTTGERIVEMANALAGESEGGTYADCLSFLFNVSKNEATDIMAAGLRSAEARVRESIAQDADESTANVAWQALIVGSMLGVAAERCRNRGLT